MNNFGYKVQVEPVILGTGVVTGVTQQTRQLSAWISAGATYLLGGSSLSAGGSFGIFAYNSSNPIIPLENFRGSFNLVNLGNTHTVNIFRKFSAGYGD